MSSNPNYISLANYEAFFILYMDDELNAEERQMVEHFLVLHPHLQAEWQQLFNTKLPAGEGCFFNKEELMAPAMRLNVVDEDLLLYVDEELDATKKELMEKKIINDKDLALQYLLLTKTKVSAAEVILHPNKTELYRHDNKVKYFPGWMRVAVAVALLLMISIFVLNRTGNNKPEPFVVKNKPAVVSPDPIEVTPQQSKTVPDSSLQKTENSTAKMPVQKEKNMAHAKSFMIQKNTLATQQNKVAGQQKKHLQSSFNDVAVIGHPSIGQATINDSSLNKTIAYIPVTTPVILSYTTQNDPPPTAVNDGDFEPEKKIRAKGFLRRLSRFIQRNTGIGTANADADVLVGVVALKLK